jgi:hypothetical protein
MPQMTVGQKEERYKFVHDLVGTTLSRREITEMVAERFGVTTRTAQNYFTEAMDAITDVDPRSQRRNRAMVIEKLSHLMKASQMDIDTLERMYQKCQAANDAKEAAMIALDDFESESQEFQLQTESIRRMPSHKISLLAGLIAEKGRIRSQLVRTLSDLSRIYGLYTEMPLIQAIQVMANSELLPPELALKLSSSIVNIQQAIEDQMKTVSVETEEFGDVDEYTTDHLN